MHTALSSRRADRAFSRVRMRLAVASCALAAMWSFVLVLDAPMAGADPIRLARFTEENLPAQDLPSGAATPEAGPTAEWEVVPPSTSASPAAIQPSTAASPQTAPSAEVSPSASSTDAVQLEPTPLPTPADIAPLEVGSVAPQMQISDSSLDGLIQNVHTAQPALAASLRVTDQARDEILNHHEGDAIQTLMRAMSIDGSNPYAYFYLGRAYLAKKNYEQAITFLGRAENRLGNNPQWLGETLAFEGLANEQAGQNAPAIACYQKALVAVPGNLMARVGLTRLGGAEQAGVQPVSAAPQEAPDTAPDAAPDAGAVTPPPTSQPPPPAAN